MFKKSLATALLVVTVPAIANAAWFLTTQVTSSGGSLTSSNGVQGSVSTITRSYNTITEQNPTAAAATGFTSRGVVVVDNNTKATLAVPFTPVDGHSYAVSAGFQVNTLPVSASINAGTVTPTSLGSIYHGYTLKSPLTFTFSPKAGYAITGITGVPAGITPVIPGGTNARATVTFPAGYTFTSSIALAGTAANLNPTVNAPKPVDAVTGAAVSLSASVSNIANPAYAWTYVSGPANTEATVTNNGKVSVVVTPGPAITLAGANTATPSFTAPNVPGQYKFTVTVSGQTKLAVVNVHAAGQASVQCRNCHVGNGIKDVADTSSHVSCQSCHFGGAGHPGSVNAGTVNASTFEVNVDNVANGSGTAAAKGTNFCASCHGATGNPAHAVPALTTHQNKACSACHASSHETQVASAACEACHATVTGHTPAAMGTKGCVDCHNGHNPTVGTQALVGSAAHPAVTLYTFEEVGYQMNNGQPVPVQVDANGKGMPYSPKMTCGTSGCHVINGVNYTYDKISDHAFHSAQGRNEFQDTADGKLDARKNKPWGQSTAMVGKW